MKACALGLLAVMGTAAAQAPGPARPVAGAWVKPTTAQIDRMIVEVLDGANSYGWDDTHKGILINWRRDDPTQVQCNSKRCDTPDKPTRHDPINDVRLLQHMYWYSTKGILAITTSTRRLRVCCRS